MNLIFIGYILIFFHFKINGIDLLPDFVGYLLIASGLGRLEEQSELFVKARPWAYVMSVISIFYGIAGLFGITYGPAFVVLNLATGAASLYLMYLIGHGIYDTEQKRQLDLGGAKFLTLWKVQAVLTMLAQVSAALNIGLVVYIVLLPALIANIVFLVYLYRAKKVLEEAGTEGTPEEGGYNEG